MARVAYMTFSDWQTPSTFPEICKQLECGVCEQRLENGFRSWHFSASPNTVLTCGACRPGANHFMAAKFGWHYGQSDLLVPLSR